VLNAQASSWQFDTLKRKEKIMKWIWWA
jgi:hypothetical protein